jgi:antitoxin component of MazEF toxin-antitoxin module
MSIKKDVLVRKFGDSFVIILDKDTRKMLGIVEGDILSVEMEKKIL